MGAFMGYLLGLRQQRKIDTERDDKTRLELIEALKEDLNDLVKEVMRKLTSTSGLFGSLDFNFVSLDLPTFTSIVNSGQLFLLDLDIVRRLRELNSEIHEHNILQSIFAGVAGPLSSKESLPNPEELKAVLENPNAVVEGQLVPLLKVVISKRNSIAQKAQELIRKLSEPGHGNS